MKASKGFSYIEIAILLVVLSASTLALSTGILESQKLEKLTREQGVQLEHAQTLLDQIRWLSHGPDGVASATQITDVVSRDGVRSGGSLPSIQQLWGASPISWQYEGSDPLASGNWTIDIDTDLNADGDTSDTLEGIADILRVAISFDGRLLVQGIIAKDPNQ